MQSYKEELSKLKEGISSKSSEDDKNIWQLQLEKIELV